MELDPPLPSGAATPRACTLAVAASAASWTGIADLPGCLETFDIGRGERHRLPTSTVLHSDVLCLNVYWLWAPGAYLEARAGGRWYMPLLLCFGFVSSVWEWALLDGGVWLSGIRDSLFGFLGVLSKRDGTYADCMSRETAVVFVIWMLLSIAETLAGMVAMANIAHVAALGRTIPLQGACSPRWPWPSSVRASGGAWHGPTSTGGQ